MSKITTFKPRISKIEVTRGNTISYEDNRKTASERGYDNTWHKVRRLKLSEDPLCERCKKKGNIIVANLVHHKDRNPKNNLMENLESLCTTCHEQEHREDRKGDKNL